MAFDRSGNLYVANWADGTIHTFDANGSDSLFATNAGTHTHGITFDSSGNLYVADYIGSRILEFNPSGQMSLFATNDTDGMITGITNDLHLPTGLAFDRNGNLFVALYEGTIVKFDPNGHPSVFASSLSNPYGLAFDEPGNLYVANQGNNTIAKFTPNGQMSLFATNLSAPDGIAFDTSGNLYVVNYLNSTIVKLSPDGQGALFASSGLYSPIFIAVKHEATPTNAQTAVIQITTIQAAVPNEVYLKSTNLLTGANYQVQISSNLTSWANSGSVFMATNSCWVSTNSWMVPHHTQLFFRLLMAQ